MLRAWQQECIDLAIKKYHSGENHFFCQATPGAGKTIMAATLANKLLQMNMIDIVICFSPSKAIAINIQKTFSKTLNCRFDGKIGATGQSFTYQSLMHLPANFWQTLKKFRVLVLFDEIHHCSGSSIENSNTWGQKIITEIQSIATYTLALSGTPWRTDNIPIAMAQYTNPEGMLICDYQYSLARAIKEKVCRYPQITLVDNDNLTLTCNDEKQSYSAVAELVTSKNYNYRQLIFDTQALEYILKLGCERLSNIRQNNKRAGGLIVTASVEHAKIICSLLTKKFNKQPVLVTYQHDNAIQKIENFIESNAEWIVSVGMISEGTDIPRLQVCCHLSSVKTELYFRQILGRILRANQQQKENAWLYTFAEPNLMKFAQGIDQDIPDANCIINLPLLYDTSKVEAEIVCKGHDVIEDNDNTIFKFNERDFLQTGINLSEDNATYQLLLGNFKKRVINAFQTF